MKRSSLAHRTRPQGQGPDIRTSNLQKTYSSARGEVHAVRGIDLEVAPGEFFGLLGPNGAGKSTTIGMLTTLVVPTAGEATVAGINVTADPVGVKRKIGVVAQNNTLDRELTVAENLEFRARFFGFHYRAAKRRAAELLDEFGLAECGKAMPEELSGGQARKLMIARSLVHRPEVLFLDEPTAGLDPQSRLGLQGTLRALHAERLTILLTTHRMEEAEVLCERAAVMDRGKVLACGTAGHLTKNAGADTVITVRYDGAPPANIVALADRTGISKVEAEADQVRVFAPDADGLLGELVAAGTAAGLTVRDAVQLKPSLETVFLTLTGRDFPE
jgi:ABC-type multidrug transport system ATPase subunit